VAEKLAFTTLFVIAIAGIKIDKMLWKNEIHKYILIKGDLAFIVIATLELNIFFLL
jgi:hypothetical protein